MARKNNSIWITTDLILANTQYSPDDVVLIMSAESIDLIEAIAAITKEVVVFDASYQRLQEVSQYIQRDNVRFEYGVYPSAEASFDAGIIFIPKGRDFARAQIWSALNAIKPEGILYIAGANKGGAKTAIKDAQAMTGSYTILGYKKSHRVAAIHNTESLVYPEDWVKSPHTMKVIQVETPSGEIDLCTLPGIFSWDELDQGTKLLLENTDYREAKKVLDMGCGNGIIGTLAAQHTQEVTLVDENLLAVRCASATIEKANIKNAKVLASNVFSALGSTKYDLILCNPPFHQKFEVSTDVPERIIQQAPKHLNKGGRLLMVCNIFLKYEPLFMQAFTQSRIIAQNEQFKVIEGVL